MSEEELLELLISFAPERLESWAPIVVTASAFLSFILPKPKEDAHPLVRAGYKVICVFGLGAGRLKAAGKLGKLAKIGTALRGKK